MMNYIAPAEWWRPDFAAGRGERSGATAAIAPEVTDSAVPFWALMSFTFILLLAPQQLITALAPYRIALLTGVIAVTTYLFDRFIHRQPIIKVTREMQIAACLVGWAILTVPFSYWPGGSMSLFFNLYLKALIIFWLLSNTVTTVKRLRLVAWGLSLMAVPLAASGINQYLSGNFIEGGMVKRIVGYDAPLTGNPNDLALMLNLILPFSVALFLMCRRPVVRLLLSTTILLEITAVILTFSRSGFLTLAAIFAVYYWKLSKRPERGWVVAALAIALVFIPLLPSGYLDRLSTIQDIESDPTGSAQARWNDTVAAVSFVFKNPVIGAGVGMDTLALNKERGAFWKAVHNVYLQYAVGLGVPGLVFFLLLLIGCIKSAIFVQQRLDTRGLYPWASTQRAEASERGRLQEEGTDLKSVPIQEGATQALMAEAPALEELFYLAQGIQISLVAFSVAAMFHPVAYHFYFYYMAGLAIAVRAVYENENEHKNDDHSRYLASGSEREGEAPSGFAGGGGDASPYDRTVRDADATGQD